MNGASFGQVRDGPVGAAGHNLSNSIVGFDAQSSPTPAAWNAGPGGGHAWS
jgi:hypothetical protein